MSLKQEKQKKAFHPLYFLFTFIMWILVIGWLAVIFSLSAESAEVSSMRSLDLVRRITDNLHIYVTEVFVRNCAHIIEFTILSTLAYIAMFATNHVQSGEIPPASSYLDKLKNDNEVYIAVALWITALSAAADEYHQIFVQGRSASLLDVFLDLSGAFVLMMIIRIVVSIHVYVKNKKQITLNVVSSDPHIEEM